MIAHLQRVHYKMTVVRRSISSDSIQPVDYSSSSNSDVHHEEIDSNRKRNRHRLGDKCYSRHILCPLCLVVQVALFVALVWNENARGMIRNHQQQQPPLISAALVHNQDNHATVVPPQGLFDESKQCTLPTPPRPRKEWTTKPILVPGYPSYFHESQGTSNGDVIQPLIQRLTGLKQGSRNFHASSRTQKRCHTKEAETVTCSQVHPIVDIGPEKHQKLFDSHVILALQNFAMAFPMAASIKGNRYSNTIGQATVDDWRKTRDLYLEEAFAKWKSVITTWKSYDYYKITMYLPYEHLMDTKGPLLIQRLAKQLQSAGFDTVNLTTDLDQAAAGVVTMSNSAGALQCIWKRSIQGTIKFEEAYIKYKPAYTPKQRDYMLQQMQQFIEEIRTKDNDMELINILKEYQDEIHHKIPIEEEDVSTTTTA